MGKSRRDILDTEAMIHRLGECLAQHAVGEAITARDDAYALRRISMTLHRWHELECGDSNTRGSWVIARGHKARRTFKRDPETQAPMWEGGEFTHDDDGAPFLERHHYLHGRGKDTVTYSPIPDREAGAKKRLAAIMARYPVLQAYVQTDPRGAALYILRPADVPAGKDVSAYYSRGLAVYR